MIIGEQNTKIKRNGLAALENNEKTKKLNGQ